MNRSLLKDLDRVFIIAEAGVNHNGDLERALRLVDAAAQAGADAVKFQTFQAESITSKAAPLATYQKKNGAEADSQFEMLKKLELSEQDHEVLRKYAQEKNILFFSTGFDIPSLHLLKKMGLSLFKVPSGEITNLPYLEVMAELAEEVIISTGMSSVHEVQDAVKVFLDRGFSKEDLVVLHCNTEYPTPFEDVHLRAMAQLGQTLGVRYGYSDHTLGIEIPIAAAALGAVVLEKHFTLDKNLPGPDHRASLDPNELKAMVEGIRRIEKALGQSEKKPSPSELKNIGVARKSIVTAKSIKKGDLFTTENLTTKRPGTGLSPMKWHAVLGTPALRDYEEDELL